MPFLHFLSTTDTFLLLLPMICCLCTFFSKSIQAPVEQTRVCQWLSLEIQPGLLNCLFLLLVCFVCEPWVDAGKGLGLGLIFLDGKPGAGPSRHHGR